MVAAVRVFIVRRSQVAKEVMFWVSRFLLKFSVGMAMAQGGRD